LGVGIGVCSVYSLLGTTLFGCRYRYRCYEWSSVICLKKIRIN